MLLVTHEMAFAREVSSHVMFLHRGLVERRGRRRGCSAARAQSACQFVNAMNKEAAAHHRPEV